MPEYDNFHKNHISLRDGKTGWDALLIAPLCHRMFALQRTKEVLGYILILLDLDR